MCILLLRCSGMKCKIQTKKKICVQNFIRECVMNEERTVKCLRQVDHIRGHL